VKHHLYFESLCFVVFLAHSYIDPEILPLILQMTRLLCTSDTAICSIGEYCHDLMVIDICGCRNITDVDMLAVTSGCPNLEEFHAHNCVCITDLTMISIGEKCQKMKTTYIDGCSVTKIGEAAVIRGCPLRVKLPGHGF
jgi:hypothetical protein